MVTAGTLAQAPGTEFKLALKVIDTFISVYLDSCGQDKFSLFEGTCIKLVSAGGLAVQLGELSAHI